MLVEQLMNTYMYIPLMSVIHNATDGVHKIWTGWFSQVSFKNHRNSAKLGKSFYSTMSKSDPQRSSN